MVSLWLISVLLYGTIIISQTNLSRLRIIGISILLAQVGFILLTVGRWISDRTALQVGAICLGWWAVCILTLSLNLLRFVKKQSDTVSKLASLLSASLPEALSHGQESHDLIEFRKNINEILSQYVSALEHIRIAKRRYPHLIFLWCVGDLLAAFGVWLSRVVAGRDL